MSFKALLQQAEQLFYQKEYQGCHQVVMQVLQQDKFQHQAYFWLAQIALEHNNFSKTTQILQQCLALAPTNSDYQAQLAKAYLLDNQHIEANKWAQEAAKHKNLSANSLDTLAVVFSKLGLHKKALTYFQQATNINKDNAQFFYNMGSSYKFVGEFQLAREAFEQAVKLKGDFAKAYFSLASLKVKDADFINWLSDQLKNLCLKSLSADDSLYVNHALAIIEEQQSNYHQAYEYLQAGKSNKLAQTPYSGQQDLALFNQLRKTYNANVQGAATGFQADEAIFVVGMPRTGTTLVERILTKAEGVGSAGELQNFGLLVKQFTNTQSPFVIDTDTVKQSANLDFAQLGQAYIESTRAVTKGYKRFVDKMPLNFLYGAMIAKALPNSKIVCLDRHPLDTIVSNYRQLFSVNFSYYDYAYDLTTCAEYYVLFKELTDHWQQLYPDQFYKLNYQALVNSPEPEAKKLLEFCNLPWQSDSLDIHKNTAPVATASAVQVRQPINNKSVGNWQKFDFALDGAKAVLTKAGIEF